MNLPHSEPELLSLAEILISQIAYKDMPIPRWLDPELQQLLGSSSKTGKIRLLIEVAADLERISESLPRLKQAFLPYDRYYILASKRSILSTGIALSLAHKFISGTWHIPEQRVGEKLASAAGQKVANLSEHRIDDLVLEIIRQCQPNDTGESKLILINSHSA